MDDASSLDELYFVDEDTFNCPFCRRRNVPYSVKDKGIFNWSRGKKCYFFTALCSYCGRKSFHLTFDEELIGDYRGTSYLVNLDEGAIMDDLIIYSRPTSFFTLDGSIYEEVREHISESEQALQFNLLTGSSASLRKAIYTLLKKEGCIVVNEETNRTDYSESIKKLKHKFSFVDGALFDTLGQVQGLTSDNVHEDAWKAWSPENIRFLIELVKSILTEMYVEPERHKTRLKKLEELRSAAVAKKVHKYKQDDTKATQGKSDVSKPAS